MKKTLSILLVATATLIIVGCQKDPQPQPEPTPQESITVECHNGKMIGYREGHLAIFKGIPFAVPPKNELRWKDPVEAPESDAEIICKKFGHVAIQAKDGTGSEPAAASKDKDEDCLTLNIWTQDFNPNARKAVMFYIHGGAYALGGTVDPMYDGRYLATLDSDIIVVTTNYRISIMGFMPLDNVPGYTDEYKNAGILGILDQQMALKWVKRNIAKFGGDPDNVTIFGESAGGGSVLCHLVMPSSKGLFKRAIMMSGEGSITSPRVAAVSQTDDGTSLNQAKRLMEITGETDLTGLKSIDQGKLIAALDAEVGYGGTLGGAVLGSLVSFPVYDDGPDAILPHPYEALKNGAGKDVDIMIGTNFHEMNYFGFLDKDLKITNPQYKDKYPYDKFCYWNAFCDYAVENFGTKGQGVKEAFKKYIEECPSDMDTVFVYERDPNIWRKTDLLSEMFFRQGSILTADLHSRHGNTFMYYFGVPHYGYAVRTNNPWVGACHAADVPYAFNNYDHQYYDSSFAAFRYSWSNAFIRFAKTGNPGWDQYDSKDRKTMVIDREGTMKVVSNPRKERTDILQPVFLNYFNARTSVTSPNLGKN